MSERLCGENEFEPFFFSEFRKIFFCLQSVGERHQQDGKCGEMVCVVMFLFDSYTIILRYIHIFVQERNGADSEGRGEVDRFHGRDVERSVLEFVCYDERRTITEDSERDHVRKCTFSECV